MSTHAISTSGLTAAVFVLLTVAASVSSMPPSSEWSPIQTRSEPVSFAPEFFGQHSDVDHQETIRKIASIRNQMRTRSHLAHPESSPFVSSPKVASVSSDDSQ